MLYISNHKYSSVDWHYFTYGEHKMISLMESIKWFHLWRAENEKSKARYILSKA